MKTKLIIVIIVIGWVCSLFWVSSIKEQSCESICRNKAYRAYHTGIRKVQTAISRAPFIADSLWATKYLGVDVLDTYFAKGSTLNDLINKTISSEGITTGSYFSHPDIHIRIDGCDDYITVSLVLSRLSFLEVSDSYDIKHKSYYGNEYYGDVFVKDCIIYYSEIKHFLPKTSYDDVSQWIEQKIKAICKKITEKNKEIIEHLNKRYVKEKENGTDNSYHFDFSDL